MLCNVCDIVNILVFESLKYIYFILNLGATHRHRIITAASLFTSYQQLSLHVVEAGAETHTRTNLLQRWYDVYGANIKVKIPIDL